MSKGDKIDPIRVPLVIYPQEAKASQEQTERDRQVPDPSPLKAVAVLKGVGTHKRSAGDHTKQEGADEPNGN